MLSNLFLGGFLILYAIVTLGWVEVSATFIGVVALIAGVLVLLEGVGYAPWRGRQ